MMILITVWNFDYGPMAKYETNALKGDLFSDSKEEKDTQRTFENPNGRVLDLILPVLVLIVCCVPAASSPASISFPHSQAAMLPLDLPSAVFLPCCSRFFTTACAGL